MMFFILTFFLQFFSIFGQLVGFRLGKKYFVKIVTSFAKALLKIALCIFIYFVFIKTIILSLFEIDALNFTMHILTAICKPRFGTSILKLELELELILQTPLVS